MSYPSHPGPYGQYPGGPNPQYGGQQPMPSGPYGQPGGFGPPPPSGGNKAGVWIGVSIVVVALVAFAITAFVAPGFLVGGSKSQRAANHGTAEDFTVRGVAAQDLGDKVAEALKTGKSAAVTPLLCPDATEELKTFADEFREPQDVSYIEVMVGLGGKHEKEGLTTAVRPLSGSAVGRPDIAGEIPTSFTFVRQADGWCWQDLRDIVGYLEDFHDALNAGDLDTLHSMQCSDGSLGLLSDPLADAIALGGTWTMENHSYHVAGADADFVGGDATLDIGVSSSGGQFCVLSGILEK